MTAVINFVISNIRAASSGSVLVFFVVAYLVTCSSARMSVMYVHDKSSDVAVQQCLKEMYPKGKQIEFRESDMACILYCIFKKFGIMNSSGQFNLEVYRRRVRRIHHMDQLTNTLNNFDTSCVEKAENTPHKGDVCKKARVFNDCTRLYRMLLR